MNTTTTSGCHPDQTPPRVPAPCDSSKGSARAAELIASLSLVRHPEGGWYREHFRSASAVRTEDGRPPRRALTSIDFLLTQGEFSAWHRVASDEVWHLLEGEGLVLWLLPPDPTPAVAPQRVELRSGGLPRHVVPAGWWQAAEPVGELAYVGATVGPGFEFEDFSFGRDDTGLCALMRQQHPAMLRLL